MGAIVGLLARLGIVLGESGALAGIVATVLRVFSLRGVLNLASTVGITLFSIGAVRSGLPQEAARTFTNVTKLAGSAAEAGDQVVNPQNPNSLSPTTLMLLGVVVLALVKR